jgi:hypothetical protein
MNARPESDRYLAAATTRPDPLSRKMKLESLKERIARADYAVDPDAVAEALIRRLDVVRLVASAPALTRRGAHSLAPHVQRRPS